MKIKLTIGHLNPIRHAIYAGSFPHAKALNTDFIDKMVDTVEVFVSVFLYVTGGLFILTTALKNICEEVRDKASKDKNDKQDENGNEIEPSAAAKFFANFFYYPLKGIDVLVVTLQFLFAIPLMLVCLPFIGIAHGISKIVRSVNKNTAESLPITTKKYRSEEETNRKRYPLPPRQSTTVTLKEFLSNHESHYRDMNVIKVKKIPQRNEYKIKFELSSSKPSVLLHATTIVQNNQDSRIRALAQVCPRVCFGLDDNHFFDTESKSVNAARP